MRDTTLPNRRAAGCAGPALLLALSIAGAPAALGQSAGSFGRAMSFDGIDDEVVCSGNFDSTQLTIEAWIYVRDYGPAGYGGIVTWGTESDASYELGVFGLDGPPEILFVLNLNKAGSAAVVKGGMFQLNAWSHIAVTYDGQFMNFYSNGVFIDSQLVNVPVQPGGPGAVFTINNLFPGADQFCDAIFDDIRIWDDALTQDEIQCTMSRSLPAQMPHLIAYYTFDEASGQTVTDFSGFGRHGVLGTTSADESSDPTRLNSTVPGRCFDVVRQPQTVTQCRGGTVVLEYGACSLEPVQYQWRHDGVDIPGATLGVYTITGLDDAQTGTYDAVATSPCGSVTSIQASVSICDADFDCSGFVDTDDFDSFIHSFEAGDDAADFDHSGFVDTDDFTAFVLAFEGGC